MNLFIVSFAECVLANQLQIMEARAQSKAIITSILIIFIFRLLMCLYLKKFPLLTKPGQKFGSLRVILSAFIFFILLFFFVPVIGKSVGGKTVEVGASVESAIAIHYSNELEAGTRILKADEYADSSFEFNPTVELCTTDNMSYVSIWDYAESDGDYVQILIDGQSLGEPFFYQISPKQS